MTESTVGPRISEWLEGNIFDAQPAHWKGLQDYVAQLFRELGWAEVQTPYKLQGVRITKEIDVYGVDSSTTPGLRVACECKYWGSAVPQGVVMEFRAVLEDSGVGRGFIISRRGFQSGALEAAKNTSIILSNFDQLQKIFWEPWLVAMSARLHRESERLFPFFDVYWFERLPRLDAAKLDQFALPRDKYRLLFSLGTRKRDVPEQLPISIAIVARNPEIVEPFRTAGIRTYRAFFDVLLRMAHDALEEFSSLFGIDPTTVT